jgi:hypothetical protein
VQLKLQVNRIGQLWDVSHLVTQQQKSERKRQSGNGLLSHHVQSLLMPAAFDSVSRITNA